ncbi:MAG: hypothetical protein JNM88_16985 [Chitinophagaceae bacterium]|nr:hypothetical protein [Chitinophagaceae bacterium]
MQRRFILIAFLFIYAAARTQSLHFETYTPANGLLDTRVIKIFQDDRGLMYFLTWEGLSIFDGQRFHNISENNGESLGLVNDMIQWKNDTCYVFTFQKGVYKLIHNRLIKDERFSNIIEPNQVLKTNDNKYIITSNIGVFEWDGLAVPKRLSFAATIPNDAVDNAVIKDNFIAYINNNSKNLYLLNLHTKTITDSIKGSKAYGLISNSYFPVLANLDGRWVQLNSKSLKEGKLNPEPLSFLSQLPVGFVPRSIFVSNNKLWLEDSRQGYLLFNPSTGDRELFPPESGLQREATLVFTDKENNYWFGIFSKKVQKAYTTKLKKAYTEITVPVTGVITGENNNTFAISDHKTFLLNPNNSFLTKTNMPGGITSFLWQNRLWTFKTTSVIESEKGEIIDLLKGQNETMAAGMTYIGRITFDKEGRLLIPGNNLFIIEKDLTVHAFQLPSFADNITVDHQNTYRTFGRNGNISSVTITTAGIQYRSNEGLIQTGGPRYAIHWNKDTFCIGTRQQGIVWLTLSNGKAKEVARLNTSKGLSNNFVSGLVRKNERQLYAATQFGLDEISMSNGDTTVQSLSAANNLFLPFSYVIKDGNGGILARSNDGQLWAVEDITNTNSGFIPAAWFDDIYMNGKAISDPDRYFSYNQNNFRFTVAAPCFTNASNIRFRFLLESKNNRWEQQSAENFYSINNLSPGRYTLTATVMYPGKIYPDKKLVYIFTIRAPLWKRGWFIISLIALTGLILWTIIRNYYRRKLAAQKAEAEKQQAIEKERNRISRDMHDDLGSGLTKIAILSEVAKKQLPEPDKAKEQLEKISESSRELVDNLQDIIWVLNPRNDTLESLSAYIREYALKYFEPLAVTIRFDYPAEFTTTHLSEEKRRNVYMTVKETLNNIAKHAWCNNLLIAIKETARKFEVSITDDGKGFDTEKIRPFANGLKNMQTRIEQSGGTYSITSAPGKGTNTTITMPV